MFSVFLYQLAGCCETLQYVVGKQKAEIQNIEGVINALGNFSGMEEVIGVLKRKKEEINLQQQSLLAMLQGLEKIRICYDNAEQKISDNSDGGRYSLKRPGILMKVPIFGSASIEKIPFVIQ